MWRLSAIIYNLTYFLDLTLLFISTFILIFIVSMFVTRQLLFILYLCNLLWPINKQA